MAQELGRLERKAEMLLERTPDSDGADLLRQILLSELQNAIRDAIKDLFNDRPAGSYELYPACPPAGGSGPAPPDVVEWTASTNPLVDLAKRVDALALLIQFHKNMGQPICRTPITGAPVTVNFISEPD
jgi:hypothetical protein